MQVGSLPVDAGPALLFDIVDPEAVAHLTLPTPLVFILLQEKFNFKTKPTVGWYSINSLKIFDYKHETIVLTSIECKIQ